MTLQHWIVAHRRTENTPTVPVGRQEEDEQATQALIGPVPPPDSHSRREHTAWTRETLAEVYGYASLGEMHTRITSNPRWYDFEVEDMTDRNLSPWQTQQLVRFHGGSLVHYEVEEAASDLDSVLSQYDSAEESDEDYSVYSGPETRDSNMPSSGHDSDRIDTPPSPGESHDGNTQLVPRALQWAPYSIEEHTMVLYQDLMTLFHYHTDVRVSHNQTASMLANTEMDLLMSRYEANLAYFKQTSSNTNITPGYLYSGVSERVKQSIVYRAYISSDRTYFPTSSFSGMPWSYLGPKTYLASRLKRQRISSDLLMVFQNKRAVLREFKDVLWGRRRYLKWLERYPEVVAKAMWMLDPTFTYTRVGLIDSLVERLEE